MSEIKLDDIVSLAKRRGFIYPGSEIYGGLAGTYDYGPLGTVLKRNIVNTWLKFFVDDWEDMYQIDSAILMNPKVWQASGHVETFSDPLIEDIKTKKRYRLDHLLEENGVKNVDTMTLDQMAQVIKDKNVKSPDGNELGTPAQFNMMFKTPVGPTYLDVVGDNYESLGGELILKSKDGDTKIDIQDREDSNSAILYDNNAVSYLRPETAQGMFTNFKNIVDSFQPDLPFGIAQIGKSFRNEISPGNFIFRLRELEIMEFEFFIRPEDWEKYFEKWLKDQYSWFKLIGLDKAKLKEHEVPAEDRAHYSKRTVDIYYDFPSMGFQELTGLAYRTDFDLKNHQEKSGKNLSYIPKDGSKAFIPHVIEPTFGLDRHILAVLSNAYTEDEQNGEKRVYLKLPANLAPIKVAVLPLVKNKPELTAKAQEIYKMLKKEIGNVMWVDSGNIGKNYRKMDEIGTPYCVTIDFDTLEDDTVTVRHRDTTEQERVKVADLSKKLK